MEDINVVYSAPLKQLMDEHILLRAEMDAFYEIAEEIEFESGPTVVQLFTKLHKHILDFNSKLNAHSKREEGGLFPMMACHLDEGDRTIEVMEFEHEKAEQHLKDFLNEAKVLGSTLSENDMQSLTVYAVQAYTTLTQHFAKEEKVLFPLAEKILSETETKELEHLFNTL